MLKVGTIVHIKKNLDVNKAFGGVYFHPNMVKYLDTIQTIKGYNHMFSAYELFGISYFFDKDMFDVIKNKVI